MKQFTTKEITKDLLDLKMYIFIMMKNPTIETIRKGNVLDLFESFLKEKSKPNQFGCVDRISEYSLKTLQHIKKYNITTMLRPKMLVALSKGDEYLINESRRLIHKYEVHDKVMIDGKKSNSVIPQRHDYSLIRIK